MFGAAEDRADAVAFARPGLNDGHHFRFVVTPDFRFVVTPEDAAEMTDLRAFTRDLAVQMESDLGTRLDRAAIAHWNTDNPHVHLVVRGVTDDGSDLAISRDYISHGLRSRAEDLVAAELGPRPEHEIPLSRGRWKQSAGRASTRRSEWRQMTAASSTCGRTRARATARRAVSPSADCRSWSASVSPWLQGQANG